MSRVSRFLNRWRERTLEREFDDELRFHLEARIDANLRRGLSREDADAEARRHLGSTWRAREGMREARISGWVDEVARDFRHGVRGLRRTPAFTLVALLLLALGIGATTAVFSVVNSILIRPLPYPDSAALVRIVHVIGGVAQPYFSDAIYLHYVANTRAFEDVGVWSPGETATITGLGDPEEVAALTASRGVLTTLGVRPEMGRWFSAAEDTPGSRDVVLLTYGYWQRRFGGDPGVLDRALTINGRPHQVVGVMPDGFQFDTDFEIVLPLRIDEAVPSPSFRLLGVARLESGITLAQANADVSRILDLWFQRPGANRANRARWAQALTPLKQDVVGDVGTTLWVLLGAIGIVLLMACANVANLLLVRADARRAEIATRAALGASRARIARQLLVESLTLALAGVGLGVALAYGGLRALVAIAPANLPRLSEISLDPVVLSCALLVAVASGLLFGLAPILKYARPRLAAGRGAGMTRERQRSQHALVAIQLGLALVLLVSAGLMIRSFEALRAVDPGFTDPDRLLTFSISIPAAMVPEPERVTRMQRQVLDNIAAIPGIDSAAFTTRVPMGSGRSSAALLIEDRIDDPRAASPGIPPNRQVKVISPGLFRTQGTPLVAGRDFTWTDLHEGRHVAIVSENLARETWGSPAAALGKRIRSLYEPKAPWRDVVGVAGDAHDDGVHESPPATVYWPAEPDEQLLSMSGFQARRVHVVIRTDRADTLPLLDQVRGAVWSVSATLPLAGVRMLEEIYRRSMVRTSFTLVLLAIAASMALLLGTCGLYGLISYAVSLRRREIGVRMALGAHAGDVRQLFLRRAVLLVGIGLTIGLAGSVAFAGIMRSLLFGIGPLDAITFAVVPLVLALAALLASYLAARRASLVSPLELLTSE